MNRRTLIAALAASLPALATSPRALADTLSSRPVRIVVPFGAGGIADLTVRAVAQAMGEQLKTQIVIENKPGAGGIAAGETVARAAPDGHTLVMVSSGFAINASLSRKLPYDTDRDFAPVVQIASVPNVLVVHPSLPVRSLGELLAFARKRPGQLNYASAGSGSSPHLSMELLRNVSGIDVVHVPYKGSGPAMFEVISGHITMMLPSLPTAMG